MLDVNSPSIYNNVIKQNLRNKLDPPSWQHPFDVTSWPTSCSASSGYTVLAFIGLISIMIALVLGGTFGAIAGYYGKRVDNVIMRIMDVFLPFLHGDGSSRCRSSWYQYVNLLLAIAIPQAPRLARIVRLSNDGQRQEYIEATRALGASNATIIMKYVRPTPWRIIVQASLMLARPFSTLPACSSRHRR